MKSLYSICKALFRAVCVDLGELLCKGNSSLSSHHTVVRVGVEISVVFLEYVVGNLDLAAEDRTKITRVDYA